MLGLSILPVPAPVLTKTAGYAQRQELHQQSLSIIPITAPAKVNTSDHLQGEGFYPKTISILPASFTTSETVKTFVCVFCQDVASLVIGEFLQFQVR